MGNKLVLAHCGKTPGFLIIEVNEYVDKLAIDISLKPAGVVFSPLTNLAMIASKGGYSSSLFFVSAAASSACFFLNSLALAAATSSLPSPLLDQQ
ncbi:hypothetical protein IV203_027292 [Nitzschia inconspicua]|uniref:Uncharacterized protein n=1 Tax=Nitzschia inconspicua TaxID=303405 RepID=A0A9K3LYP6_9STRA|nr:hypothetical protein IV203_027292 [Nitzschia inconspicua]